jgi:trk system potassium uptake protein TrkA
MSDKRVVVVGGGRVGFRTAEILAGRGHDVLVVERDADRCDEIADEYVATVVNGDATRPSILSQTDLETADALLALTGETGTNLAVCFAASRMEPTLTTVLRTDVGTEGEYEEYVDRVVFPERAGARVAANTVEEEVRTLADVTGPLDVLEMTIAEGAPVDGRTLADVSLPRGSLVVSAADGERIAGADTELVAGRTYVVAVEPDVADEVRQLFRG